MISLDLTVFWATIAVAALASVVLCVVLVSRAIRSEFRLRHDDTVMQLLAENKMASEKLSAQLAVVQHLMGAEEEKEPKP